MDSGTIDGYQGGERAITVLCIVGSDKLGFMALSARLLTGVSRAADGLAVITNCTGIETGEKVYDLLKHKIAAKGGFAAYQDDLPPLKLTLHDSDVSWNDADGTNAEDGDAAPDTSTADTSDVLPGPTQDINAEGLEAASNTAHPGRQ